MKERQGIILKALQAARTAIYKNDYRFDVPEDCERSKADHKHGNSTVSQFLTECTISFDASKLKKINYACQTAANIWQSFKRWLKSCNEYQGISRADFEQEMAKIYGVDVAKIKEVQHYGDIYGRFYPVLLNDEARELYSSQFFLE